MSATPQLVLHDGDVVLRLRAADDYDHAAGTDATDDASGLDVLTFVVEHQGLEAGTIEVCQMGGGQGELSWAVSPGHQGRGVASRAVRLLIRYAFEDLGLNRVVAHVEPGDRASLRIAGRAGLRREGVVRGAREHVGERRDDMGELRDHVQLARLATDPEPTSGVGFIGVLNAGLPTKRVIAQGLIRNSTNEILLCELTYKQEWDLPGGVVDPGESPAHALVREIREELHVDVTPKSLVAANWLPPWRGWDDATLFVFDLGVADDVIGRSQLEPKEIRALHWCSLEAVEHHAAPYVTRMLGRLWHQTEGTAYLEDGCDPDW